MSLVSLGFKPKIGNNETFEPKIMKLLVPMYLPVIPFSRY
jgi:hypothetical protein